MSNEKQFHVGVKALILSSGGDVLLMKEDVSKHSLPTSEYWDFPGGRMQESETVIETLHREVLEETGIVKLSNVQFRAATISNHQIKLNNSIVVGLVLMVYGVEIPQDTSIKLSNEHLAYEWVDMATAKQRLTHKYPQDFIDQL